MDPHYSNHIFVYGTTHETGHKQPKFMSSENAPYFSEPEEHTESLYYIPKWNWYLIYFSWIAFIQEMST